MAYILFQKRMFNHYHYTRYYKILNIKNEFLYHHSDKVYCLDDYIDYQISLKKGDIVKLVGVYGIYAYVIKNNTVGWVKYRYLKKLQFKHQ